MFSSKDEEIKYLTDKNNYLEGALRESERIRVALTDRLVYMSRTHMTGTKGHCKTIKLEEGDGKKGSVG